MVYSIIIVQSLSCVQIFSDPWTVACQAPLSWNFPGKNTRVGCHVLLQEEYYSITIYAIYNNIYSYDLPFFSIVFCKCL